MNTILFIMALFIVKHFVVDFLLQREYQLNNKGTYGHPGGLIHAGLHGITTAAILSCYIYLPGALILGAVDAVIHYHIDWVKTNINDYYDFQPTTGEKFWWLLGADQLAHYLTYVGILSIIQL